MEACHSAATVDEQQPAAQANNHDNHVNNDGASLDSDLWAHAEQLSASMGIPWNIVEQMLFQKTSWTTEANPMVTHNGVIFAGPLMVHQDLLAGGKYTTLVDENNVPFTLDAVMADPMVGLKAGLTHLKNLGELYDGNWQYAVNHYETGDYLDSSHGLVVSGDGVHSCGDHEDDQHGIHDGHDDDYGTHDECDDEHGKHDGHDDEYGKHDGHDDEQGIAGAHGGHHSDQALTQPSQYRLEGVIPASGHHGSGHVGSHGTGTDLNATLHNSAVEKAFNGLDVSAVTSYLIDQLEMAGEFNPGKSDQEKLIGAYSVLNMFLKQAMVPASILGSEINAAEFYGQMKLNAVNGDAASLRSMITSAGGSTLNLSDDELLAIWGYNEHNGLHSILGGGGHAGVTFNAIHMTSLNDNDQWVTAGTYGSGTLGGFNDKGAYPQWGWFEDLQKIPSMYSFLTDNLNY